MPRSVLHPLSRQAGTERFFCLISCIEACNFAVHDTYDTAGSEKPLPFSFCTKLGHPTQAARSICSPFSPSPDSGAERDVDRDAVRCMGHLAWCPRQWGSWVVSSIVRYRADMPCRTAMCFMVHKSMHTIMKRCICTGRALCGRFTCHISLFAARQRVHNTSLTLGLGLGRLSGRHRPKLCSWPPHKHRCPWLSIGYG